MGTKARVLLIESKLIGKEREEIYLARYHPSYLSYCFFVTAGLLVSI